MFSGVTLFCLSFGVVAAGDHLQHLPCLTMKPSFIPRVEGLCSSSARLLRCKFLIEQIKQPATALASPPHCPPFATGLCVSVWCRLSWALAISQPGTRTSCWSQHEHVTGACAACLYRGSLLRNTPGAGSSCAAADCALGGGKWLEPQVRGCLAPTPCLTKGTDIQCQLGNHRLSWRQETRRAQTKYHQ